MIDVVIDDEIEPSRLPTLEQMQAAVSATCKALEIVQEARLCIRFASNEAVRELNRKWLGGNTTTDVLAFPMQEGPDYQFTEMLGDIIMAWPFVKHEADRLGLPVTNHALHLIIHAVLHLLGLDHAKAEERHRMHTAERRTMLALGLHDPYPQEVILEDTIHV